MVQKMIALKYLSAPVVIVIQRFSLLFNVIAGKIIYGDKDFKKRLLASEAGIPVHVDGCLGGFIVQFSADGTHKINFESALWQAVASVSIDLHKFGTVQKGVSALVLRIATFAKIADQVGNVCSLRSQANLLAAMSCMLSIGQHGYEERAQKIVALRREMRDQLKDIKAIELVADPQDNIPSFVLAFRLAEPYRGHTYGLARLLEKEKGWHLSKVGEFTLHFAITNAQTRHEGLATEFAEDVKWAMEQLARKLKVRDLSQPLPAGTKVSTDVGVYGMSVAPKIPFVNTGTQVAETFLTNMVRYYALNLAMVP